MNLSPEAIRFIEDNLPTLKKLAKAFSSKPSKRRQKRVERSEIAERWQVKFRNKK